MRKLTLTYRGDKFTHTQTFIYRMYNCALKLAVWRGLTKRLGLALWQCTDKCRKLSNYERMSVRTVILYVMLWPNYDSWDILMTECWV